MVNHTDKWNRGGYTAWEGSIFPEGHETEWGIRERNTTSEGCEISGYRVITRGQLGAQRETWAGPSQNHQVEEAACESFASGTGWKVETDTRCQQQTVGGSRSTDTPEILRAKTEPVKEGFGREEDRMKEEHTVHHHTLCGASLIYLPRSQPSSFPHDDPIFQFYWKSEMNWEKWWEYNLCASAFLLGHTAFQPHNQFSGASHIAVQVKSYQNNYIVKSSSCSRALSKES